MYIVFLPYATWKYKIHLYMQNKFKHDCKIYRCLKPLNLIEIVIR